jgi:hypothetical protein
VFLAEERKSRLQVQSESHSKTQSQKKKNPYTKFQ